MKLCVFGAGAIGGFVAAKLAQVPGLQVSVVARGAHLDAIRERGLRVVSPAGDLVARVQATDDARTLGPQDCVFIALKQHQVAAALPLFEQTLALRKETIGREHPDTLLSMHNLAAADRSTSTHRY